MRRVIVKFMIVLAVLWSGWWFVASTGLQGGLQGWLEDRRAEGWEAQAETIARTGFPLRIGARMQGMMLDDPATGAALRVPRVTLSTPVYWPGYATVTLPAEAITLTAPQGTLTLTSEGAQADLRLRPGRALELESLRGTAREGRLDLVEGRVLGFDALEATVQQTGDPRSYDVDLGITGFAPGSILRQALRLPHIMPDAFDVLEADMTLTFQRPWDRTALEDSRPQPRQITVTRMEAMWDDLRVALRADLDVAEDGVLDGTLTLQAENWQRMLELASTGGTLTPQMRSQIENGLNLLSGGAGTLDVTITVDQGRMRMGFIPLGSAPRIILR